MSDAELAASHDRAAFLELHDRYVSRIERYVAAHTLSVDVEDIVSTTFERALARRSTFKPSRGTYASWLFRIARNAIADSYRARARHSGPGPERIDEDRDTHPEQWVLAGEDRARVRRALRELTEEQRAALALRYAAGLPFGEVARALGKTEPAAKKLVQRGLRALRRLLEEDGYDR
jgi:RNA polymerase sigma-70 factor (ECF subfamily)